MWPAAAQRAPTSAYSLPIQSLELPARPNLLEEQAGSLQLVVVPCPIAAARGELTPAMLMHLIDESYEDLLSHQGADLAEAEGGESVPWDEVKRELGL